MSRAVLRRCAPGMVVVALVVTTSCSRPRSDQKRVAATPAVESVAARPSPPAGGSTAQASPSKPPRPRAPPLTPFDGGAPVDLITIRLLVDPPKRAHVIWGVKDFGVAPLEIRRPRGSGPVDLELRAPGFLTLHTRVFTERDNSLSVHLVPETEAARFSGYQSPAPPPHGKADRGTKATGEPIAKRNSAPREPQEVAPVTLPTPQGDVNSDGIGAP